MASDEIQRLIHHNVRPDKKAKIVEALQATQPLRQVNWSAPYAIVRAHKTPTWMAFKTSNFGVLKEGLDDEEALALLAGLARIEKRNGKTVIAPAV